MLKVPMVERHTRDLTVLFLGDVLVAGLALWLALFVRHFEVPTLSTYGQHLAVFSILFALSLGVFLVVGLYDRTVALFERSLPGTVLEAQAVNACIAVLFFFFAPVALQPKTILVLYFAFATLLTIVWRLGVFRIRTSMRRPDRVVVVGSSAEYATLVQALSDSPQVQLSCVAYLEGVMSDGSLANRVRETVRETNAHYIVTDPHTATRLSLDTQVDVPIIDALDLFEERTLRVPLSLVDADSLRTLSHSRAGTLYGVLKRAMDISVALILGALSLPLYPLVWLAIYSEDRGPLFVRQERVGKNGVVFPMYKFRSMTGNDSGVYGEDGKSKLRVTRVGAFLRKTRIDELPQLWSVVKGDQSLIGPRPELPPLVAEYCARVPLYDLRHLVTPGLSGWAQVYHQAHPHHGTDITETERKLSYDLYYVKHRSLFLDLVIALKTIKTLLLRVGA